MFHEKTKMSAARSLRGGCHCGRNRYIIKCSDPSIAQLQRPQLLFNDRQSHREPTRQPETH
jgi:hypothetical protein